MTSWTALAPIQTILIQYYFGNAVAFYGSLIGLFVLALMVAGLELRLALVFAFPFVVACVAYGVFGAYTFVGNVFLLVLGVVYAYMVMDLFT